MDADEFQSGSQTFSETDDCSDISEVSSLPDDEGAKWTILAEEVALDARTITGEATLRYESIPRLTDLVKKSTNPSLRPFAVKQVIYMGVEGTERLPALADCRRKSHHLPLFQITI